MELSSRECGSCTKCCEGYNSGSAHGIKFGNIQGRFVLCHFLEIGLGCTIYEDRPKHPCQMYKCHWLTTPDVPEHFKPEISHIMATRRGQSYIVLTNAGPNPNSEVIEWYKVWCSENDFNLAYSQNGQDHFFGNPDFVKMMYASLGST